MRKLQQLFKGKGKMCKTDVFVRIKTCRARMTQAQKEMFEA